MSSRAGLQPSWHGVERFRRLGKDDVIIRRTHCPDAGSEVMPRLRSPAPTRDAFVRFTPVTPRWNDLDVFGHVNNAEFYGWFDTAVLVLLNALGAVNPREGGQASLVVESGARFHREVLFTDAVEVGLRVAHLGTTSVRYELGIFTGSRQDAAVDGFLVHVFADRETRRPSPIPDRARVAFARLMPQAQPEEEAAR